MTPATGAFTIDNAEEFANLLRGEIHAPYVNVRMSTLGGRARPSLFVAISLDDRETWAQAIFENSRYVKLYLHCDGEMGLTSDSGTKSSWHPVLKKRFRKTAFRSWGEAIDKINRYLKEAM